MENFLRSYPMFFNTYYMEIVQKSHLMWFLLTWVALSLLITCRPAAHWPFWSVGDVVWNRLAVVETLSSGGSWNCHLDWASSALLQPHSPPPGSCKVHAKTQIPYIFLRAWFVYHRHNRFNDWLHLKSLDFHISQFDVHNTIHIKVMTCTIIYIHECMYVTDTYIHICTACLHRFFFCI